MLVVRSSCTGMSSMTAAGWHACNVYALYAAAVHCCRHVQLPGGSPPDENRARSCLRLLCTIGCNLCCAGFQLLADDLGGWGGICHDVLQQLRDQYPSQPVLYFSLQQQQQQQAAAPSSGGLTPAQTRCAANTAVRVG